MKKLLGCAVACLVGLVSLSVPASAVVVDSVNETKAPAPTSWNATEVGWHYTPAFGYDLTGIETKFLFVDNRIVTVELYDEHPLLGGMLLRSAGFAPSTSFAGGTFASLSLTAGEDYFVGFRNVGQLGVNVTQDAGATSLGALGFSFENDGTYNRSEFGFTTQPILRFIGEREGNPSPTPEPASMALLGMGALPLLRRLRRRNSAAVAEAV